MPDFEKHFDPYPIYAPDQHTGYTFDAPFFGTPERTFETEPPRKMTAYRDEPVDVDEFRAWFYQFENPEYYPDKLIISCAKRARMFVPVWSQCDYLDGDDRKYARGLLIAHIVTLTKEEMAAQEQKNQTGGLGGGTSNGIKTSASVGSVNVSYTIPNSANAWEFWLNKTPFGLEFQAFLSNHVGCGIYAMGDDIRSCFRD